MKTSLRATVALCLAAVILFSPSCGKKRHKSQSSADPPAVEEATVEVELGVPLTVEQFVAMEGVRQGAREEREKGAEVDGEEEIEADVFLNEQKLVENARARVEPGVSPGVRVISTGRGPLPLGDTPEPIPGAPPRARVRSAPLSGSAPAAAFGISVRFRLPSESLPSGSHGLRADFRPRGHPEVTLVEVRKSIDVAVTQDLDRSAPVVEISETEITRADVDLPDADDDGVSTLIELASSLGGEVPETGRRTTLGEAIVAASDAAVQPSEEVVQAAFLQLGREVEKDLSSRGVKIPVAAVEVDLVPPDTRIDNAGASGGGRLESGAVTNQSVLIFSLGCNEEACTFRCSLDNGAYEACGRTPTEAVETDGEHVLSVRAADSLGNSDRTPATFAWGLDRSPPETAITKKPSTINGQLSASFEFSCSDSGVGAAFTPPRCTFMCQMDVGTPALCASPVALSSLSEGAHTFSVQAQDAAGNVDASPASYSWTIDTTAPDTTLVGTGLPALQTNQTTASFSFASPETGATFQCSLDGGTYATCLSPLVLSLSTDGPHAFAVRAVDAAGNVDASPAAYSWIIDTAAPDTTLAGTGLPALQTNQTAASFSFTSPDAAATFQCRFDQPGAAGSYAACASLLALSLLKGDGSYALSVRAVDPAGNPDASPAYYTWTLDTLAPDTSITASPTDPTSSTSASFSFTSPDAAATFECKPDAASYSVCASSVTLSGLSEGSHTYSVRARDVAGNVDGSPATSTWTIDFTAPVFSGVSTATAMSSSQINLSWSAASDITTAAGAIVYETCQATASGTCGSSFSVSYTTNAGATAYNVTGLSNVTTYYFVVRSTDTLGNRDGNTTEKSAATGVANTVQAIANHLGLHTCALLSNGSVKCWGYNVNGSLGDGSFTDKPTPVAVISLAGAVTIAGGANHSCSLISDGSVKCWGHGSYGDLGDGSTADKPTPVTVSSLTNAVAVTGGNAHACVLLPDGSVKCWGYNLRGQVGDGSTANRTTPVVVSSLTNVLAVTGGYLYTCALVSDGVVKCWGDNFYGQLGDGTTTNKAAPVSVSSLTGAIALSGGDSYACSVLQDGSVKCWGSNNYGQLGDGSTTDRITPVAVSSLTGAVEVAAGVAHACSLLSDGSAKCWGLNANGRLGDGTTVGKTTPVSVSSLTGATAVSAGSSHSCSMFSDGTVKCWGGNGYGQLGDGTTTDRASPVAVTALVGPLQVKLARLHESAASGAPSKPFRKGVAGGEQHTCALISDGTVRCWGHNQWGGLGNGTTINSTSPVTLSSLSGVAAVAAGTGHSCALISDGSVRCWGKNQYGEVGDGTTTDRSTPVQATSLTNVLSIVIGGQYHTCALLADGTVKCWGRNDEGQVGDGSTANRTAPTAVSSLSSVVAVAGGGGIGHSCALMSDGSVKCWGYNASGQLGDGSAVRKTTPLTVSSLSNVTGLAGGGEHTCALISDGTARCWGQNLSGQVGDGSTTNKSTSVAVSSFSGGMALVAGTEHTCALIAGGAAKCWGEALYGQLGDGTTAKKLTPVAVSSLSSVLALTGGYNHVCALISDGTVKCWGWNSAGQLGDGTTTNRSTSVSVTGLP